VTVQKNVGIIKLFLVSIIAQGCNAPWLEPRFHDRQAWAEPAWGEVAEGLRCRLRPDKRVWQQGEALSFKVDMRNQGGRMFAFAPSHIQQICRIQFDGRWYHWPNPAMIDGSVWPLAPGVQFDDILISLDKQFGVKIAPGRHIIRVAFALEGVEVVSNPVGIKILPVNPRN
jgi:hypothetical protein